jgi:Sulfotransferase family
MGKPEEPEVDRLRRELWVVDSERLRLRAELEEMRRYGFGALLDWLRVARRLWARVERRFGRAYGGPADGPEGGWLPSRLTGTELARLTKRRIRIRSRTPSARPRPRGDGAWLVPVLVDYFGRDGSTATMAWLAASPRIVVDSKYPFERRYFTYLWRWSQLLERTDWPGALWGKEDVVSLAQDPSVPLLGPPPWFPRPFLEGSADGEVAAAAFEFAWRELSARAVADRPGAAPRYYAEKHSNTWAVSRGDLPEHRLIVMLRDPRDVQASIEAFEDTRPEEAFAANLTRAGLERLPELVQRHRSRLRWIAGLLEDESALVVRFEDLSSDPDAVAAKVAEYLEIEVPGRPVDEDGLVRRHMTATAGAVGRWKTDLDPSTAERLTLELAPELEAVGLSAD